MPIDMHEIKNSKRFFLSKFSHRHPRSPFSGSRSWNNHKQLFYHNAEQHNGCSKHDLGTRFPVLCSDCDTGNVLLDEAEKVSTGGNPCPGFS
jgi:hypothetical protein